MSRHGAPSCLGQLGRVLPSLVPVGGPVRGLERLEGPGASSSWRGWEEASLFPAAPLHTHCAA